MANKSFLIGEVINNLYHYGKVSLQIVNEYITDKDWFIHFKVNEDHNIDIYRESIIYTDDSKEEIEEKYFWNVDSSELSYYISYLLSASLTGGLKIISDNSLNENKELNDIVEKMYKLVIPKLNISNKEIADTFIIENLIMLDIFESKENIEVDIPKYESSLELINNVNIIMESLEKRIDYIRDLYVKLISGNLGQLDKSNF